MTRLAEPPRVGSSVRAQVVYPPGRRPVHASGYHGVAAMADGYPAASLPTARARDAAGWRDRPACCGSGPTAPEAAAPRLAEGDPDPAPGAGSEQRPPGARGVDAHLASLADRVRRLTLPCVGLEQRGEGGRVAQFALRVADGRIAGVQYRASTCATLLAYCQCLAELLRGRPLRQAARVTPWEVAERVLGVPPQSRAHLIPAYLAALDAVRRAQQAPAPAGVTVPDVGRGADR